MLNIIFILVLLLVFIICLPLSPILPLFSLLCVIRYSTPPLTPASSISYFTFLLPSFFLPLLTFLSSKSPSKFSLLSEILSLTLSPLWHPPCSLASSSPISFLSPFPQVGSGQKHQLHKNRLQVDKESVYVSHIRSLTAVLTHVQTKTRGLIVVADSWVLVIRPGLDWSIPDQTWLLQMLSVSLGRREKITLKVHCKITSQKYIESSEKRQSSPLNRNTYK